ncbi:MAG: DUF1937 family protein [Alphaproteobacteria bacterium]|nr:DUF1937 family protein [Alphaproteobacteria bacterium]
MSHPDEEIRLSRVEEAVKFGAWVMDSEQKSVYVAAFNNVELDRYRKQPTTYEWWYVNMESFLSPAESCYVLCLDGWKESKGVAEEIAVAKKLGKEIIYYKKLKEGEYIRADI